MMSSVIIAIRFLLATSSLFLRRISRIAILASSAFCLPCLTICLRIALIHRRNIDADRLPSTMGCRLRLAFSIPLAIAHDCLRIKGGNQKLPRLGNSDIGKFFNAHLRAIYFDDDSVQHRRIGAIRAQAFQFCFKMIKAACIFIFVCSVILLILILP